MPGKPKHIKAKHSHTSKKSRARQRLSTPGMESPSVDVTPAAATGITSATSKPPENITTQTRVKTAQYPYIGSELRRIFLFAGIILVVLIILSQVLS